MTMSSSLSILDTPRPGRRVLPFRGRAAPAELGSLTASGSRNPEGESGNRPFVVTTVLPAGSSRALRVVLLPGHIQWEKRLRDIAIAGKNENNSWLLVIRLKIGSCLRERQKLVATRQKLLTEPVACFFCKRKRLGRGKQPKIRAAHKKPNHFS